MKVKSLGNSTDLKVNKVIESETIVKKTKLISVKGADVKLFGVCAALLLVATSVIIFYACKKDASNDMLKSDNMLKKELAVLNDGLYSEMNIQKGRLRDAANAALKVCAVAGSDIIGAAAGVKATAVIAGAVGVATGGTGAAIVAGVAGVVCGAGASYVTGTQIYKSTATVPPNSNSNSNTSGWDYLNCGNIHNCLLQELYEQFNGNDFDNLTLVNLGRSKFNTQITAEQFDLIFTSAAWFETMEQVKQLSIEYGQKDDYSTTQLLYRYHEKGLLSDNVCQVLNSFFEVYSLITDEESISAVVSSYVNFVENTTLLSAEDKTALLVSLGVASKSPFFWMNFIPETTVIEVESVTLGTTALTLIAGETATLTATVIPSNANQSVIWESSNPAVAMVTETGAGAGTGFVTGIAKGRATIIVTTQDGNKTSNCHVTVRD